MPDGQALPEQVRLALFRIYQQALNNVVRHAQASLVSIRFELDAQQTLLQIQDDGRGFEVPKRWIELVRRGHLGLVGIVERAEAIGGRLEVVSTPGEGSLVRVVVPRLDGKETGELPGPWTW
jgi:signal transduction histidine kinase